MTDALDRAGARRGCYPGSFDPLTVAHLAIAEAAVRQCALDRVDLVLSHVALGKADPRAPLGERVAAIERAAESRPWLGVRVTDLQLLADIAAGYDVVVMGADKWEQLHDVAFYGGSATERDSALDRLPVVACAPRGSARRPDGGTRAVLLDVPAWLADVSSTAVHRGATHWSATQGDEPQTRRSPE